MGDGMLTYLVPVIAIMGTASLAAVLAGLVVDFLRELRERLAERSGHGLEGGNDQVRGSSA